MRTVLVDTDIVIEVLRRRNLTIRSHWEELVRADALIFYSPVTMAEVWRGVREREADSVTAAFAAMTCAPLDAEVGRRAGDYLRRVEPSHGLDLGDALIAATASIHGVPLWTRNRKHYPMKDVRLV